MRIRSRFLRIFLTVSAVTAFAGYFAFATFVFSPTESSYAADVSTLVPRDVDFFVAKSNLRGDFAKPLRLAMQDDLDAHPAWITWINSQEYAEFEQQHGLEAQLAEARAQIAQLGIDPLKAFGGKDVAIAGYFRGPTFEQADWAAYGRCNWMGKLAVAGLNYPSVVGLEAQGLVADRLDEVVMLSGARLPRPLHVTRIRDVIVVGTSKALVERARELEARGGQESFGLSANYNDYITQAHRTFGGHDLEVYCDWRTLAEKMQVGGRWPDPQAEEWSLRLLSRVFQLGSLRAVAGTIGFDRGVIVDAHADLSSETITPFQKGLYRQRGRESAQIVHQIARIARPDSQVVAHVECDLGELLTEVYASLDAATRQLLDEVLRSTGQYTNATELIKELDVLFKGRIGLIARENDYPTKAGDPPHNDVPVPAITAMLWIEGGERSYARLKELQRLISDNQGKFGLQGRNGGKGVFINTLSGGFEAWEFWNPFIDGTGHIAVSRDADVYFISNSFAMLSELLSSSSPTARAVRLSEQPQFTQLVNETLPSSNIFLWVNPGSIARTMRAFASRNALEDVKSRLDWNTLRAVEEEKVIRERFPGKRRGQLDDETQRQVNDVVTPILDAMEQRALREQVPALKAAIERKISYFEACSQALLTVALDPKAIDVAFSAIVPLGK